MGPYIRRYAHIPSEAVDMAEESGSIHTSGKDVMQHYEKKLYLPEDRRLKLVWDPQRTFMVGGH